MKKLLKLYRLNTANELYKFMCELCESNKITKSYIMFSLLNIDEQKQLIQFMINESIIRPFDFFFDLYRSNLTNLKYYK